MMNQPANPTSRQTHVNEWAEKLAGLADENEKLIVQFGERLSSVLRPDGPVSAPPSGKDVPEEYLVPLADQLRRVARSFDRSNNELRSLLHRLEN